MLGIKYLCFYKELDYIPCTIYMSNYTFSINNYHAIHRADIAIDGLTVLSGLNGCGKSTIARWIYYAVNGIVNFEKMAFKQLMLKLEERVRVYARARRTSDQPFLGMALFHEMEESLDKEVDFTELTKHFFYIVNEFCDKLSVIVADPTNEHNKELILKYLELDDLSKNPTAEEFTVAFREKEKMFLEKAYAEYRQTLGEALKKDLKVFTQREYDLSDSAFDSLSLCEGRAEVIAIEKERFYNFLNIDRAIYIDTPMAVGYRSYPLWEHFNQLLVTKNNNGLPYRANSIALDIEKNLNGTIEIDDTHPFYRELLYIRNIDNLRLKLSEVATGFKSFAYLQQLLNNGHLDDKTILLIDEPEAHLHPQWVVEFAHILVLLHKIVGVRVVVASHSPDFIAAIQSIARKEEVIDNTRFYLAEESKEEPIRFDYKDLGQEIDEIFGSFNIAYDRIAQYGDSGVEE